MLRPLLSSLSDLVYPPHCLICKSYLAPLHGHSSTHLTQRIQHRVLCETCLKSIQFNIPPFCLTCSRHLGAHAEHPRCKECVRKKPRFDFAWGACLYNEPMKKLIHQFKYSHKTGLQHLFTELIISFLTTYRLDIAQFDLLMPVPLSPARLRERGFNQSQLLAQKLSRHYHTGLSLNTLIRSRHTPHQAALREKERWTNISGAFRMRSQKIFLDKNVLLIDDLLTTGATASEAARILKEAGARRVGVLTLAITAQG